VSERSPRPSGPLADQPVAISLSEPELLGRGFRPYERYRYGLPGDPKPDTRVHDALRFGPVVAVLPIDLARDEVVVIRQFRLPAHLATGRGELIEIVAGHVEGSEALAQAAHRECLEEIGVAPAKLVELFTYLPTPGASDEEITLFVGLVDASLVPASAGLAAEHEETRPMRVSIDAALAALSEGKMRNGLLVLALHWLALNRGRLREMAGGEA
jgi:ADP-ribose pyrophosphatase